MAVQAASRLEPRPLVRVEMGRAAQNHSPFFFVDETALLTGVRALANLAADYLQAPPAK